jgi:hypothetical protein
MVYISSFWKLAPSLDVGEFIRAVAEMAGDTITFPKGEANILERRQQCW